MVNVEHALTFVKALKVLIIDGDKIVGHALAGSLDRCGMRTLHVTSAADGLARERDFSPDVVLVDLDLPDTDGITLVGVLAQQGDCGIIILSARADEADRIVALEVGADDYVAKPPHLRELLARIRAVHRRVTTRTGARPETGPRASVRLGTLIVDLAGRTVRSETGERIMLTAAEFTALEIMLEVNGTAVSRDRLSKAALHRPWHSKDRSVDQLIFSLRQKLAMGDSQQIIHSSRGAGYLLSATVTPIDSPAEGSAYGEKAGSADAMSGWPGIKPEHH